MTVTECDLTVARTDVIDRYPFTLLGNGNGHGRLIRWDSERSRPASTVSTPVVSGPHRQAVRFQPIDLMTAAHVSHGPRLHGHSIGVDLDHWT